MNANYLYHIIEKIENSIVFRKDEQYFSYSTTISMESFQVLSIKQWYKIWILL